MGAALAFYTILSLAPLVIIMVAILALAFGRSTAEDQLLNEVQGVIGREGSDAVRAMLEHAQKPASGTFGSILGLATLLFAASGVFAELRAALNRIWAVKVQSATGIWEMVRDRIFSFGMVLAIGFLLLVSLVLSAALAAVGKFFSGLLPMPEAALSTFNFLISFVAIAFLFMLIFRYVPERKNAWKDVWMGAIATAFLFDLGKLAIGVYLGKAAVGSAYGAAGSVIVLIVWVYYSAMIFFFGAEFTHEWARPQGNKAS